MQSGQPTYGRLFLGHVVATAVCKARKTGVPISAAVVIAAFLSVLQSSASLSVQTLFN
jgi:hypothetical protein